MAFDGAISGEWVSWLEGSSGTFCVNDGKGTEAAIFQVEFTVGPEATIPRLLQDGYLPLSLIYMEALDEEPLQFFFTQVPDGADEGKIETPDNVIVPTEFTRNPPHYTFVAAVTPSQVVGLWEGLSEQQVMLAVHGYAPGFEGPTLIGMGFLPYCWYRMDGTEIE